MATPVFRAVLSEIPDPLDEGWRATTFTPPQTQLVDDAMLGNVPLDNQVANMSLNQLDYNISPLPSPDELVIRQRGRRRFAPTWSPDKVQTPTRSPFQRTPTKVVTTGMILRSSPRKRLSMGTVLPLEPPANASPAGGKTAGERTSPRKQQSASSSLAGAKVQLWPGTPTVKKLRIEERPLSQLNNDTPLDMLLKGLSQAQLVTIIGKLVGDNAKREEQLRNELPCPDISNMEQALMISKRNIFKCLPTSRLCRKTDSSAYARAVTHLSEFKRILMCQAKLLYDGTHWDALLDYVTMAWDYVRATPVWDNAIHNTVRRQCFKVLSCHCIAAVKYGGLRLGAQRLHALECNLTEWSKDHEDVLSCVNVLNRTLVRSRNTL